MREPEARVPARGPGWISRHLARLDTFSRKHNTSYVSVYIHIRSYEGTGIPNHGASLLRVSAVYMHNICLEGQAVTLIHLSLI